MELQKQMARRVFSNDPEAITFLDGLIDRQDAIERANDELKLRLDELSQRLGLHPPVLDTPDRLDGEDPQRFFLQLFLATAACTERRKGQLSATLNFLAQAQEHLQLDLRMLVIEHRRDGTAIVIGNEEGRQGTRATPPQCTEVHEVCLREDCVLWSSPVC